MIQSKDELEKWYSETDPWGYYKDPQDVIRKAKILSAIPKLDYKNTLDIGCGNGFLTNELPGKQIVGVDISEEAIRWAKQKALPHVRYESASLFDLIDLDLPPMDLILITGVLYPQYIGPSIRLIYVLIDQILKPGGILVCSHIYQWYKSRFPYLTVSREYFPYRDYSQILEVYCK